MSTPEEPALPTAEESAQGTRDWPHAPPHRLSESGVYFVTARTRNQAHLLAEEAMKDWFQATLFELAEAEFGWKLEAWAILSNHYHLVVHSPAGKDGADSLSPMLRKLHSLTTKELNRLENQPGRTRLFQNYRETYLTYQQSYLARLNYVHQNAVHHGLVAVAADWKWCSASAFEEEVSPAWSKTVSSFKFDQIARDDGD